MADSSTLAETLSGLAESIKQILVTAKQYAEESVEDFVSKKIGVLGKLIGLYCECFKSNNVTTRKQLEDLCGTNYRNTEVQDAFDELTENENDWMTFLEKVDKQINNKSENTDVQLGSQGPCDVDLVDVRTGDHITLEKYLHQQKSIILVLLRHFA